MKRFVMICVIQSLIMGSLHAQQMKDSIENGFLFKKKFFFEKFLDTSKLKMQKNFFIPSFRDSTFTSKLKKESLTRRDSFYLQRLALHKFDLNPSILININVKYTPQVTPFLYFSLLDYTCKPVMDRVSRLDHPFDKSPRDLHYLWSGGVSHFRETGYSANYFDQSKPAYLIYIVRDGKKIRGWGIESLDDDW